MKGNRHRRFTHTDTDTDMDTDTDTDTDNDSRHTTHNSEQQCLTMSTIKAELADPVTAAMPHSEVASVNTPLVFFSAMDTPPEPHRYTSMSPSPSKSPTA